MQQVLRDEQVRQPVTVTFDLEPDDQIIPVGKRIGLMIMSSDKGFTLWPATGMSLRSRRR